MANDSPTLLNRVIDLGDMCGLN